MIGAANTKPREAVARPPMLPPLSLGLLAAGGLCLAVAALVTGADLERGLRGEAADALRWGPALFRALLAVHGLSLITVAAVSARRSPSMAAAPALRLGREGWAGLALLSALALALRLPALGSCLWFDEVLTVVDFVRLPAGHIVTTFPSQNQHMLFTLLARVATATFGESAWSFRLPSVLFGVASLWPLYLLGRRLVGRTEALLACALVTVSYHHVWFSQNARGYMGLLFFAILATWLWTEARARRTWPWHLGYAVAVSLGMLTHLTMVFMPLAHALLEVAATAWRWGRRHRTAGATPERRDVRQPLAALALSASLTLQLYALSLPEFLRTGLHEVSLESEWTSPLWVIQESLRSLQVGFGALAVVAGGALVAAIGWASIARRDPMAAGALVLPPLVGGSTMLALGHNLWPRFFFFAMGFAILIVIHGAMTTPRVMLAAVMPRGRHQGAARVAGLAAVALMLAVSAASLPRAYALPKQDFTGAQAYVEAEAQPGDVIAAVGLAGVAYRRYFAPDWPAPDSAAELEQLVASHARLWLVYTLPVELKAYRPEIWRLVERDFETVEVFPGTLGGGEVYVCRTRR
jgi:4-amino-4-deoxy-L-arabinose transferase-like glycosyltransferase